MNSLLASVWGTKLRRIITSTAGMVAAVAGAVVAVPPAWSALNLPVYATHVFVYEQVNPMKLSQADTTKAVWQLQLEQLKSSLYAAKLDEQKAPSQTVEQRIQDLEQQIQQTQAKLNASRY